MRISGTALPFFLSTCLVALACNSLHAETLLNFTHPTDIRYPKTLELKGSFQTGESHTTKDKSLLLSSKGRTPVYVIVSDSKSAEINVDLPQTQNWPNETMSLALNQALGNSFQKIHQVRLDIASGSGTEALKKAEELVQTYPNVPFMKLVRASAFFVEGQIENAKKDLTVALEAFPNNPEALELAREIGLKKEENVEAVNRQNIWDS